MLLPPLPSRRPPPPCGRHGSEEGTSSKRDTYDDQRDTERLEVREMRGSRWRMAIDGLMWHRARPEAQKVPLLCDGLLKVQ